MSENILVDPNTADEETLAQIPGVGEEMAKRILNARPYASLEDLNRVNGIGPLFLEKISPYMALSSADAESVGGDEAAVEEKKENEAGINVEALPVDEAISTKPELSPEADVPPAGTEVSSVTEDSLPEKETTPEEEPLTPVIELSDDEDVLSPEEAPPTEVEATDQDTTTVDDVTVSEAEQLPAYTTRGQAFLMSFSFSSLALLLALAIGLGVLAGINNGNMVFATPAQVSKLALEVERIDKEVKGITQDLDGLQSRVDNMEGLTSRLDEVEQTALDLDTQVTSVTSQVDEMNLKVQDLTTNVETLQEESSRYQDFFNGLKELLSNVLNTEEGSNEQ